MKYEEFCERINNKEEIFIDFTDTFTIQKLFDFIYSIGGSFPNNKKFSAWESINYFYAHARGNAKPIIHFYYNNIINKQEIQLGYKAIFKTYPQYKKIKIEYFFG